MTVPERPAVAPRRLRNRSLVDQPLKADDWHEVYHLLIGFQNAVEAVVRRARARAKESNRA